MARLDYSSLALFFIIFIMTIEAISSAIYNNIVSGLSGITANPKISIEQLQDEVIAEKNNLLRSHLQKGLLNLDELSLAINCIEVSCDYMSKCCNLPNVGEKALHFEIPPIVYINGINTIRFIGSIDRKIKYNVYTDESYRFHQYKKRGANSPYVYIDTAINSNGNMDGYIFNLPYVKYISIIALFQDPRKLLEWDCCKSGGDSYLDLGILSETIIDNLTKRYIYFYRQAALPVTPNDQQPR